VLKNPQSPEPHNALARGLIEIAFIIFLFYSNLLMGQYTAGSSEPLLSALHNIFTPRSLTIAIACALIGYVVFEYLRKRS
jgi:hypothetical protein